MGHHQLMILLKKQVREIQRAAWRSQASGLLEANLIPGHILGIGEGPPPPSPPEPRSVWGLCQEECQPWPGRTGHWHVSPFTIPKWPSCALMQDSPWWIDVGDTGFTLSCLPPLLQAFPRVMWGLLLPVLPLSRCFSVLDRSGWAGQSCSLCLKRPQLLLVVII